MVRSASALTLALGAFSLLVLASGCASSPKNGGFRESVALPGSWKNPQPPKVSPCGSDPERFSVEGDFDGDGQEDFARLLSRRDGRELGLFVWLGNGVGPLQVDEVSGEIGRPDYTLSRAGTGKYKTACGKGAWPCSIGEAAELRLKNPAINLTRCQGPNRFIYWDTRDQSFRSVKMSE
jgi:hypothetical protein